MIREVPFRASFCFTHYISAIMLHNPVRAVMSRLWSVNRDCHGTQIINGKSDTIRNIWDAAQCFFVGVV